MGTPTTKRIATNVAVERVTAEVEVMDVPSLERIIEKLVEVLSKLFLKCVMEM